MIPRFKSLAARKYDEPDAPGEGTRPTGAVIVVGRVTSPGFSPIFRGIRRTEAVKRNTNRFPADFAFQLTEDELAEIRSQPVTECMRSQRVTGSQRKAVIRHCLRSQLVTLKRDPHGPARCHDPRATPAAVAQPFHHTDVFPAPCFSGRQSHLLSNHCCSANLEGCQPVAGASFEGKGANDRSKK